MEIVALTGLSYPTVRKAIDLFSTGDWAALKPAPGDVSRVTGDGSVPSRKRRCGARSATSGRSS